VLITVTSIKYKVLPELLWSTER